MGIYSQKVAEGASRKELADEEEVLGGTKHRVQESACPSLNESELKLGRPKAQQEMCKICLAWLGSATPIQHSIPPSHFELHLLHSRPPVSLQQTQSCHSSMLFVLEPEFGGAFQPDSPPENRVSN